MSVPTGTPKARALYRDATRAILLGLFVNLALGMAKLAGGLIAGSFALLSDAVNSLGDTLTSIVVWFALWFAQRPPDSEHPYGHTRAEAIAASNVALVIILSALGVGWKTLTHITTPVHLIPPDWTLWLAGSNVLIKESLYQYKLRVGRRTGSMAVIANAWDHRSDALCALAVLIGLAVARWGGPGLAWAGKAAALVVVSAIVWSGTALFRSSTSELMDLQAERPILDQIRAVAASIPEIEHVETLWVRKSGLEYFVDIHIEVDADMTVAEGHRIGHLLKDRLLKQIPILRDVLVHLEPHPADDGHDKRDRRADGPRTTQGPSKD
ncbi:MAG TPA: cation transporter [Planctomycetaceae bacterium]|nr:cation transporter [Planctomycetaceae bacterium]